VPENADRSANRALRARFDEVYGQYERLRSGLADMQQRLATLQVTERSDDGHVTATVGPRGQLVKLELDRRIYRDNDVDALAAKITDTVRRASEAASTQVQELVGGYLPADSGAADFLKDGDFGTLLRRSDAALREEAERNE
jgi:DNA-binding protein YbaB